MVDTVVLFGRFDFNKFMPDFTQIVSYRNHKKNTENIPVFQYQNRKGLYVARYYQATNEISVQFNIPKVIFGTNALNYESSFVRLDNLIACFGSYFFPSGDYYVSRIDIGGVVTYPDKISADAVIERFRYAKLPRARTRSYKHQNYESSVFYSTRNWSFKCYNKGAELRHTKEFDMVSQSVVWDLDCTVRVEKTFRFNEMKRLGYEVTPRKGVFIENFTTEYLLQDFIDTLQDWSLTATPWLNEHKGVKGLVSIIDQQGLLSEAYASGKISKSTYYRYIREKKAAAQAPKDFKDVFYLDGKKNLPENLKLLDHCLTFGVNHFFT